MRLTVLASGSKGNSAIVATERTRILVDAGLSCRELLRRMRDAGEEAERLSAILVTHEHQDHVAGLGVLARRLKIPVFFTEPTHRAWVRALTPRTTMSYAEWLDRLAAERRARQEAEEAARAHVPDYSLAAGVSLAAGANLVAGDSLAAGASLAASASLAGGAPTAVGGPTAAEALAAGAGDVGAEAARLEAIAAVSAEAAGLERPVAEAAVTEPEPCEPVAVGKARRETDPTFLPAVEYFQSGTRFAIGDIEVCPFTIPHDAADPCGFVFSAEGLRFGLATDLGYMPPNVKAALRDLDLLVLESNHDLEMLKDGPYPWSVKQRVLSRVGHLSNVACAEFLERDYDGGAHTVVLAHLSESNNVPELARMAAEGAIGDRMRLLGNRVLLARQDEPMEPICL